LKKKLDKLWHRIEEEKEVVMMVTKQEVESSKQAEINELEYKLE